MFRLAATGFAVFTLAAGTGCVLDEAMTDGRFLNGVPVKTPDAKTVSPDALKIAERVQTLGQRINDQNIFTGINPLFLTLGVQESVLFHRGPDELFISEGLIAKCKTDAQLAAVLCSEMGRMMAERRSAKALGVDLGTFRETPEAPALGEGEVASAAVETPEPSKAKTTETPVDATRYACELLRGAGFEDAELTKASDLLAGVKRSHPLSRQIMGPSPAPKWQP